MSSNLERKHKELFNREAELETLRAFHDYFLHRCEMLYFGFGMEAVDLYNDAFTERIKSQSLNLIMQEPAAAARE